MSRNSIKGEKKVGLLKDMFCLVSIANIKLIDSSSFDEISISLAIHKKTLPISLERVRYMEKKAENKFCYIINVSELYSENDLNSFFICIRVHIHKDDESLIGASNIMSDLTQSSIFGKTYAYIANHIEKSIRLLSKEEKIGSLNAVICLGTRDGLKKAEPFLSPIEIPKESIVYKMDNINDPQWMMIAKQNGWRKKYQPKLGIYHFFVADITPIKANKLISFVIFSNSNDLADDSQLDESITNSVEHTKSFFKRRYSLTPQIMRYKIKPQNQVFYSPNSSSSKIRTSPSLEKIFGNEDEYDFGVSIESSDEEPRNPLSYI